MKFYFFLFCTVFVHFLLFAQVEGSSRKGKGKGKGKKNNGKKNNNNNNNNGKNKNGKKNKETKAGSSQDSFSSLPSNKAIQTSTSNATMADSAFSDDNVPGYVMEGRSRDLMVELGYIEPPPAHFGFKTWVQFLTHHYEVEVPKKVDVKALDKFARDNWKGHDEKQETTNSLDQVAKNDASIAPPPPPPTLTSIENVPSATQPNPVVIVEKEQQIHPEAPKPVEAAKKPIDAPVQQVPLAKDEAVLEATLATNPIAQVELANNQQPMTPPFEAVSESDVPSLKMSMQMDENPLAASLETAAIKEDESASQAQVTTNYLPIVFQSSSSRHYLAKSFRSVLCATLNGERNVSIPKKIDGHARSLLEAYQAIIQAFGSTKPSTKDFIEAEFKYPEDVDVDAWLTTRQAVHALVLDEFITELENNLHGISAVRFDQANKMSEALSKLWTLYRPFVENVKEFNSSHKQLDCYLKEMKPILCDELVKLVKEPPATSSSSSSSSSKSIVDCSKVVMSALNNWTPKNALPTHLKCAFEGFKMSDIADKFLEMLKSTAKVLSFDFIQLEGSVDCEVDKFFNNSCQIAFIDSEAQSKVSFVLFKQCIRDWLLGWAMTAAVGLPDLQFSDPKLQKINGISFNIDYYSGFLDNLVNVTDTNLFSKMQSALSAKLKGDAASAAARYLPYLEIDKANTNILLNSHKCIRKHDHDLEELFRRKLRK